MNFNKLDVTEEQIKQAVETINSGATRKDVAEQLGVSDTTLSRRLKKAGYKYSNSAKAYYLEGEEPPKPASKPSNSNPKKTTTSNNAYAHGEAIQDTSNDDIINNVKDTIKNNNREENNMKAEIQALIHGTSKSTPARVYKGVYFDRDIAHFLDNVQHGNKSELINKIVRQYLSENDLM
jgi:AraC-like DNA-binding protein